MFYQPGNRGMALPIGARETAKSPGSRKAEETYAPRRYWRFRPWLGQWRMHKPATAAVVRLAEARNPPPGLARTARHGSDGAGRIVPDVTRRQRGEGGTRRAQLGSLRRSGQRELSGPWRPHLGPPVRIH